MGNPGPHHLTQRGLSVSATPTYACMGNPFPMPLKKRITLGCPRRSGQHDPLGGLRGRHDPADFPRFVAEVGELPLDRVDEVR
jgi:hypothetical protein